MTIFFFSSLGKEENMTDKYFTMTLTVFLCLFLAMSSNAGVNNSKVKNLNFVTLYDKPENLHMVTDNFRIVQTINLKPIIEHIHAIKVGFVTIQKEYKSLNDSPLYLENERENQLVSQLEHTALTIESGLRMVSHDKECKMREKRELNMFYDEEVVNTHALFPSVGKLVNWVTGSLSADAGQYINENYNNIKRLTKMSLRFATMFNSTLDIERRHAHQLTRVTKQVRDMIVSFNSTMGQINRKLAYEAFLQNLQIISLDIQKTVDDVFHQADLVERNQLGSVARDPSFIRGVLDMLDFSAKKKHNILYLMKISVQTSMEVCHWAIKLEFIFPVLEAYDYIPKQVLSVPKRIKGNFFELANIPHVIAWSEKVYAFTEVEYDKCRKINSEVFCEIPIRVQTIVENCIFGLAHGVFWETLANRCPLNYVKDPVEFVRFSETHMFYWVKGERYCMLVCPVSSKSIVLKGAGTISIPIGCKVRCAGRETFALGHLARSANLEFKIENTVWNSNISSLLPFLTVNNIQNMSTFWDDTKDDELDIEEGIKENFQLMKFMEFTPSGVNFTLWTLIAYAVLTTVVMMVIIYCMCITGCSNKIKLCCNCDKPQITEQPNMDSPQTGHV